MRDTPLMRETPPSDLSFGEKFSNYFVEVWNFGCKSYELNFLNNFAKLPILEPGSGFHYGSLFT